MFSDADMDEDEADQLNDDELEAEEEIDKDRQASDEQEIQDLADEVDADIRFFVGMSDLELGRSAMTKVRGKSVDIFCRLTLSLVDDEVGQANLS